MRSCLPLGQTAGLIIACYIMDSCLSSVFGKLHKQLIFITLKNISILISILQKRKLRLASVKHFLKHVTTKWHSDKLAWFQSLFFILHYTASPSERTIFSG